MYRYKLKAKKIKQFFSDYGLAILAGIATGIVASLLIQLLA